MNTSSYWFEQVPVRQFPQLTGSLDVDVVVIGGGITGLTAAYLIKQSGRTVAVVERERCLGGDTGHTSAHLTCVTDARLHKLVRHFGRGDAQAAWNAGVAAINQIETIINTHGIDCEFRRIPGFLHASLDGRRDADPEPQEGRQIWPGKLGFAAQFVDSVPVFDRPGVQFANQARFHPVRYLAALSEHIDGGGSHIFENTPATAFSEQPLGVEAGGHRITCESVVIATHVPLAGNRNSVQAALLQTKLAPYTSYVIGARIPRESIEDAVFWDTSEPYYHLRIDRHDEFDYVIFGGADHKTGQETDTPGCFRHLEAVLKTRFPDAQVAHRWSGQVIETNDGLPFIGATGEREFVATGFAGNGMTFGTLAAMMARDAVCSKDNPWQKLFDVHRKKVRGGTWKYLRENEDYPYYMLKDRVAAAEGESVHAPRARRGKDSEVQREAGRRLLRCRRKCYDARCGLPAPGMHRSLERRRRTWDCPCHGSRFHPTGDVIAGPAESPLEKLQKSTLG